MRGGGWGGRGILRGDDTRRDVRATGPRSAPKSDPGLVNELSTNCIGRRGAQFDALSWMPWRSLSLVLFPLCDVIALQPLQPARPVSTIAAAEPNDFVR